ncbi:MAG: hypothetical protein JNM76_00565 [Betaproteobacteria bacterium]|nr:hypothetical protein [Betaproteobacteria bacterium]
MSGRFLAEDVSLIENNFSADSRDKDGFRVVTFEPKRALKLHIAADHIVHVETVRDSKAGEARTILTLTNGQRLITRRGAAELLTELGGAAAGAQ